MAGRLRELVDREPDAALCFPTGATPAPVYTSFARSGGDLSRATVFLLDEFVLPEGSPGRCDSMLRRDLLDHLDHPPAELVIWDTSGDLAAECETAEARIAKRGLRLAILGLGANGHIGLNEPGSDPESRSRAVALEPSTAIGAVGYGAEEPPTTGVTMGIATLLDADEIWLLVTGDHKRQVLHDTINGPVTSDLPATYLRSHPNLTVFADEAALPY